jgi:hypothetical protein
MTDLKRIDPSLYDGVDFYRIDNQSINISAFKLIKTGNKKDGSPMGDLYDIIIFPDVSKKPSLPERFQAILTSPVDYVERMVESGFLGVVVRATDTSDDYMKEVFEEINENMIACIKNYEERENVK